MHAFVLCASRPLLGRPVVVGRVGHYKKAREIFVSPLYQAVQAFYAGTNRADMHWRLLKTHHLTAEHTLVCAHLQSAHLKTGCKPQADAQRRECPHISHHSVTLWTSPYSVAEHTSTLLSIPNAGAVARTSGHAAVCARLQRKHS